MVTLIVKIKPKQDHVELIKNELVELAKHTVQEKGCIGYKLHQESEDNSSFWLYENWESEDALDFHKNTPHFIKYIKLSEQLVEEFIVKRVSKLNE